MNAMLRSSCCLATCHTEMEASLINSLCIQIPAFKMSANFSLVRAGCKILECYLWLRYMQKKKRISIHERLVLLIYIVYLI